MRKKRKETKMSSKPKVVELQAVPAQPTSEETRAEDLFNKQKAYFASDATKSYEWRVDQLNRLTRMLKDNFDRFAEASRKDFKTASQENVFEVSATIATTESTKSQLKEWMKPVEAPLPKFLAASGHKGIVYREPYGVTLIICPFNGPLILSLRPAVAALSAGNPCILKLSEALLATDKLLLELISKYFEPESFSAVVGGREVVTKLLTFLFDFIFLTGSLGVGKVVMRAAAEHITLVLLELGGQNIFMSCTHDSLSPTTQLDGRDTMEINMEKLDRITIDPAKMNGEPCIRGLRLTVRRVLEALATYPDREELKREYPELQDEDIRQALAFAAGMLDDKVLPTPAHR